MIRRLVEVHYFQNRTVPDAGRIRFWLLELRTPGLLIEAAQAHAGVAATLAACRPLLCAALDGKEAELETGLREEEARCRDEDRVYWLPLKKELERLSHEARRRP